MGGEAVRDEPAVFEHLLDNPKRELGVVRWDADSTLACVPVREVAANLAVLPTPLGWVGGVRPPRAEAVRKLARSDIAASIVLMADRG